MNDLTKTQKGSIASLCCFGLDLAGKMFRRQDAAAFCTGDRQ